MVSLARFLLSVVGAALWAFCRRNETTVGTEHVTQPLEATCVLLELVFVCTCHTRKQREVW